MTTSNSAGSGASRSPLPRTLKECKTCQQVTPHEIRAGDSIAIAVCTVCLARALAFELARD